MFSNQVYKKVGKRYLPIGYTDGFSGFPTEGIWAVFSKPGCKTRRCIAKVGEFKNMNYADFGTIIKDKHDALCKIIAQNNKSISDIADEIIVELLKNEE
jgi:hypothetical protein